MIEWILPCALLYCTGRTYIGLRSLAGAHNLLVSGDVLKKGTGSLKIIPLSGDLLLGRRLVFRQHPLM